MLALELGNQAKYSARDYTEFEYCEWQNGLESPRLDSHDTDNADNADVTFDNLRIKMGPGVFYRLYRVSAPDLHMRDLLHTIYLGLFKHMMDWIQGFLKKRIQLQAFDHAWKTLAPYPGILVPKKAYRKVMHWQGKEMRNQGHSLLGTLEVALQQPDCTPVISFKRTLACVRALVYFNMMAQSYKWDHGLYGGLSGPIPPN